MRATRPTPGPLAGTPAATLAGARRARGRALRQRLSLSPVALAVLVGLGGQIVQEADAADLRVPKAASVWLSRGRAAFGANNDAAAGRMVIDQQDNRVIYRWDSFDIGRDASVTFNMPSRDSSALNRVVGTALKPSEILGKLNSNGNVYIINRNGILFGSTAQVNVGGLVASTLEVDDDDFMAGLTKSIVGNTATFQWKDVTITEKDADGKEVTKTLATYDHPTNYVIVEKGAQINTSSNGRVLLVARKVQNNGTIRTPDGQTILAGGEKVYLADSLNEAMYAVEANSTIPAVRGLLVEVGGRAGEASNEGDGVTGGGIESARGNTTIVGMAVNQSGRISATSSVNANGSVFLLARGGVETPTSTTKNLKNEDVFNKRAQTGGVLTLGEGSRIELGVDSTLNSEGAVPTADTTTPFKPSRVELSGQTIEFKANAQINAPGATVNVRAEDKPKYTTYSDATSDPITGNIPLTAGESGNARVILGAGAAINVAGTTDTVTSVANNFVTIPLATGSDLKDAPLQKDGVLYRSKLVVDTREGSNILSSDTQTSLRAGIQRTASELMSSGGKVTITSSGAVVTHQDSTIDVSGGQVKYEAAKVNPTILVASDGARYTLANAPKDIRYVAIENKFENSTRPGASNTVVSSTSQGRVEAGYTEGRAAGSITIVAPTTVLDGGMRAQTTVGQRQALGKDALAAAGRLQIGTRTSGANGGKFGSADFLSAVANDLVVAATNKTLGGGFWDNASQAALDTGSRISASMLNASGLGTLEFTSNGSITLEDGANLLLGKKSTVDWAARGEGGITLGGDIRSAGGTVSMQTNEKSSTQDYAANGTGFGALTLKAGKQIDVGGNWVNQVADGQTSAAAVKGGTVTMKSAHGLALQEGSGINVSGGATLQLADGAVKGSDAGTITLNANGAYASLATGSDVLDPFTLQATLQGFSLAKGGTLNLSGASSVRVHAPDGGAAVKEGERASLNLSTDFFNRGGFSSFSVAAYERLDVTAGARLAPVTTSWRASATARGTASASSATLATTSTLLPLVQRAATQLTLAAAGTSASKRFDGQLTVEQGALVDAGPKGSVTLQGGTSLVIDGTVKAAGGSVALTMGKQYDGDKAITVDNKQYYQGEFRLGSQANIDVAGAPLLKPTTSGLQQGEVLSGGSITLSTDNNAGLTTIDIREGAQLNADGGIGQLDFSTRQGTVRQTVASQGGTISITTASGGAVLAGDMHARAANGTALSGTLQLTANASPTLAPDGALHVQQGTLTKDQKDLSQLVPGTVTVSADQLNQGFGSATLKSNSRIQFDGNTTLNMRRQLDLDAPVIAATAGSTVNATGASVARMGFSDTSAETTTAAVGGNATLNLNGGLVELYGKQSLQGVGQFNATATSAIRLATAKTGVAAGLAADADITLKAPQVYVATATNYTVDAAGHTVKVTGGDRAAAPPLSAAGALTVNAAKIVQDGVLRVPFGRITLHATDKIEVTANSLTSVSGQGVTVPYGITSDGGTKWTYVGADLALPEKEIQLNAPGQAVNVASGATLDLSGGGSLVGYEFTPGPGGSTDIFTGSDGAFAVVPSAGAYAPQDLALNPGSVTAQTITFGAGGMVPAGTYAVLPARYALLPGAYLVKAVASTSTTNLNAVVVRPDGSHIMAGQLGYAGVNGLTVQPSSFQVMTSAQARRYSDIRITSADAYLTSKANTAGTAVPRRPSDAGALTLNAGSAQLNGQVLFNVPGAGRGGEFNVAANRILVSDTPSTEDGVLTLSAAQINAMGADSVLLGGTREADTTGAADRKVVVVASSVTVDAASDPKAKPLGGNDLILAASDTVTVNDGAVIQASTSVSGPAQSLAFTGDGALLRVSSDAAAGSVRTGAQGAGSGTLVLGARSSLSGGAITLEGTSATQVANTAKLNARNITLGAGQVAAGQVDQKTVGDTTLVLSANLLSQLNTATNLTLRSFKGLDVYGKAALGGDSTQSLTLDTANIRMASADAAASLRAGGVSLVNTTGAVAESVQTGTGTFTAEATGLAGGSGNVTIGPGRVTIDAGSDIDIDAAVNKRSVAVSGVQRTTLKASGSVVLEKGTSKFSSSGNTSIDATSLTAQTGADAKLSTTGDWSLTSPAPSAGVATASSAGVGSHVSISGASIKQAGTIALTSGELSLNSTGSTTFAAGSLTDLSGQAKTFDGVGVYTTGGTLTTKAAQGDITLDKGAVINVSAPAGGGSAGTVNLSAQQGGVSLEGRLVGTAQAGATSGSLNIDSLKAVDTVQLSKALQADQSSTLNNFQQALTLRNRSGNQTVTSLTAQKIAITADAGSLDVTGTLKADGKSGGTITLASAGKLTLQSGAVLQANATGTNQDGGQINLLSSNEPVNNVSSGGIALQAGSTISTQATGSGAAGELNLRSARTADGKDVLVDPIKSTLVGVGRVEVEAVKTYSATAITGDLINKINTENATLAGTSNANVAVVKARLAAGNATTSDALQVRSGVEIRSTGDLTLANKLNTLTGWNLGLDGDGKSATLVDGQPMNLTLRAAGNLKVQGTLSSGFESTAANALITGDGGTLRLVGGADLKSADVLATVASYSDTQGNVTIGSGTSASTASVLVRTTTGDIQIAAGGDVALLNRSAVVYTTGKPVDVATLPGYVGTQTVTDAYLRKDTNSPVQSPILVGGGTVDVSAQRDVKQSGTTTAQSGVDWLWRQQADIELQDKIDPLTGKVVLDPVTNEPVKVPGVYSTAWYSRYDYFKQGFAAMGGGNARVSAGRDAVKVEVSAPGSGYVSLANQSLQQFGGGDVTVAAGRDVKGGYLLTTGQHDITVQAGRNIALVNETDAKSGVQLIYGDGATQVKARNDASVGVASTFGFNKYAKQGTKNPVGTRYIPGLAANAKLLLQADAGNLTYKVAYTTPSDTTYASAQQKVIPSQSVMAAANGSVSVGTITQLPASEADLTILAEGDIKIDGVITVAGNVFGTNVPDGALAANLGYMTAANTSGVLNPIRIVSGNGSIDATQVIYAAKPVRVIAAKDINLIQLSSQHHLATDLTLVQAGRDVSLTSLTTHGPGIQLVAAGRNVSLEPGSGVVGGLFAKGNRENALLPEGSAAITVLTGVKLDGTAYTQAQQWYFELLGGSGVADYAAALVDQLQGTSAQTAGLSTSSTAQATSTGVSAQVYASQTPAEQLNSARALAGEAVYQRTLLQYMQQKTGDSTLTAAAAASRFAALPADQQAPLAGQVLANAWVATVPQAQRDAFALGLAQQAQSGYAQTLINFVAQRSGKTPESVASALTQFNALPREQQLLLTNQVLLNEVRVAGEAAAAASTGSAREAAYAKAYAAIQTVFPGAEPTSNLDMGSSAIKTSQNSPIVLLAPNGGINVGQLTANSTNSAELGIVTAAGGNVSAVVRNDVAVNQSRVFTVGKGDLLMWSSEGSLDAGKGAKTVTSAPPPLYRLDANGNIQVDTSGAFSGSGIAVLDKDSTLYLYAPKGDINAGDAGIKTAGKGVFLGNLVGADNLSVGGVSVGVPAPTAVAAPMPSVVAPIPQEAPRSGGDQDDETRKRKKKRNLLLDFLGIGEAETAQTPPIKPEPQAQAAPAQPAEQAVEAKKPQLLSWLGTGEAGKR